MEEAKAATVADILVEGDLMGHDTHGLNCWHLIWMASPPAT